MTELKTLRDIANEDRYNELTKVLTDRLKELGILCGEVSINPNRKNTTTVSELRQEAIKWIKELERCNNEIFNCPICGELLRNTAATEGFKMEEHKSTIYWIKNFFNISDEDISK